MQRDEWEAEVPSSIAWASLSAASLLLTSGDSFLLSSAGANRVKAMLCGFLGTGKIGFTRKESIYITIYFLQHGDSALLWLSQKGAIKKISIIQ